MTLRAASERPWTLEASRGWQRRAASCLLSESSRLTVKASEWRMFLRVVLLFSSETSDQARLERDLHDPVRHHAVDVVGAARADDVEAVGHLLQSLGYRVELNALHGHGSTPTIRLIPG